MNDKKLYLCPEEGMIKGVCAGIARYLGVPVLLIRIIAILALFLGLFLFTVIAYFLLALILKPAPSRYFASMTHTPREVITQVNAQFNRQEQRLQRIERYVTSDTFNVQQRFRDL